jgi:hypothetical protein
MNLAGKDYFTVEEAAEYARISVDAWRTAVQRDLRPGILFGVAIYRRDDVRRFIESNTRWPERDPDAQPIVNPTSVAIPANPRITLDLTEAATLAACHPHTLRKMARLRLVPSTKNGRRWVFPTDLLQEWINEQSRLPLSRPRGVKANRDPTLAERINARRELKLQKNRVTTTNKRG